MRSIPLLAATTVMLTFVWACGDDGGNVGPNNDPVATFTVGACTVGVACTFTDTSTDPDGNNTIVSRTWDFGDGSPLVQDVTNPSHTFAAASTYQVKLTVTDNAGASASVTNPVVVSGTANTPPIASFTAPACTVNIGCLFTDASSDPDGTIASWSWNFGDGSPAAPDQNPSHTYAAAGTFNVTLTVTDNLGATGTVTLPVTVSPPTATQCTVAGTVVSCVLTMTQRSTVTITLTSRDCELSANKVAVAQPRRQNIFFNVCSETVGEQKTVTDATG
ncbi:MAG TPA: PKD domain-containing protein, partial [Gemmatimonadales bacterium]